MIVLARSSINLQALTSNCPGCGEQWINSPCFAYSDVRTRCKAGRQMNARSFYFVCLADRIYCFSSTLRGRCFGRLHWSLHRVWELSPESCHTGWTCLTGCSAHVHSIHVTPPSPPILTQVWGYRIVRGFVSSILLKTWRELLRMRWVCHVAWLGRTGMYN
jgi:hypothetical protein